MSLVGMAFHTFEKTLVEHQGVIESTPEPGYYLVQRFSWLFGDPLPGKQLVHVSEMSKWQFYTDTEAMNDAYEKLQKGGVKKS